MDKKVVWTVIIFAIVGLGVIWMVFKKKPVDQTNPNPIVKATPTPAPAPTAKPATVDVAAVFAEFPADPTDKKAMTAFNEKISALASDSTTLDISACAPKPPVMHVQVNKAFTLKNTESVERQITHSQFSLTAPANSETMVTPKLAGAGVFGYRCGGKLVGIFYATP